MSKLPSLPLGFRSWADFYLQAKKIAQAQGFCYVPDDLIFEHRVEVSDDFSAENRQVIRKIHMKDVKEELLEQFIEILERKETAESIRHSLLVHVSSSDPLLEKQLQLLDFLISVA